MLNSQASDKASAKAQAAWLRVVDKIERGELKDPNGQYVSKDTQIADGEANARSPRPKFDAALAAKYPRWYGEQIAKEVAATPAAENTYLYPAPDPCTDCSGSYTPPTPTSTFTSSVGQGGTGPIHDLKIIFENPSSSATTLANAGYIMLNADLNKGCAGKYIYFAFTRNASQVLNGREYSQGKPYSGPNNILRGFATQKGGAFSVPAPAPQFFHIWSPTAVNGGTAYDVIDLNYGAHGEYIFSYQSKDPTLVSSADVMEVGVLSGNSYEIMPPAGWQKYHQDLNEGAGGDYIFFCFRY